MASANWKQASSLLFIELLTFVWGGNVLFHPLTGEGSHYYVATTVAREMVERGHNVTILVDNKFLDNIRRKEDSKLFHFESFKPEFTMDEHREMLKSLTDAGLRGKYIEWLGDMIKSGYIDRQAAECQNIFGDLQLMSNLRNSNFDIAVVDGTVLCPLVQYLGKPFVALHPVLTILSAVYFENRVPFYPSYIPEFGTALDHKMTLLDRFKNTAFMVFFNVMMSAFGSPFSEMRKKYGITDKSLLYADAEMRLIQTHFAFDFPRPMLPNTVALGGITTSEAKPLNAEWEEYLQSAGDDGVVIFSMGSYATGIDESIAAMFAGAFAQIPQKVIWKLNGKPSTSIPPNVKIVDWMPQNDLLGHPQIKAFVYHCGVNGVFEALYHGVPMVAIPLFGDQADNAQRVVSRGWGVKVDITTLTSDQLAHAIRTVISEPSYKSNATRLSAILRDSPRTPPELAADGLEYVIRHGGAKHLRSAALDLNLFQYLLLDVISMLLIVFITIVIIAICCCKLCFRGCARVCRRTRKVKGE